MNPTSILEVQYLQTRLYNDDDEVVQCGNKRVWPSGYNVVDYLRTS